MLEKSLNHRIAVAMATYNGEDYLPEQLNSFVNQTRRPDELVVCDDGSKDGTLELLYKFKKNAPFDVFIYENENNLGCSKNFEKAICLCTGDLIFISDQDDVWENNKISKMSEIMESCPEINVAINDCIMADKDLKLSKHTMYERVLSMTGDEREFIHGCCTVIRATFIHLCFPLPEREGVAVGYDGWLHTVSELMGCRKVVKIPLQVYRRHDNNISQAKIYDNKKKLVFYDKLVFFIEKTKISDKISRYEYFENRLKELDVISKRALYILDNKPYLKNDKYYINVIEKCRNLSVLIKNREEIISRSAFQRVFLALRFYCLGGYKHFSGTKSFFMDVFCR